MRTSRSQTQSYPIWQSACPLIQLLFNCIILKHSITSSKDNGVIPWNKVSSTPCLGAYLFLRTTAGLAYHHCSRDWDSELPMWTPWWYLKQNKHVQDNISLCRMPGKRKPLTWWVAQLKTISGIFVELAGCLLTQNELISPRGLYLPSQCMTSGWLHRKRWADGATDHSSKPPD